VILMAGQDTTKVLQPGEQPLDFPAALVPAQCATNLRNRADSIGTVWCDQLNSLLLQLGIEFVAVVGLVSDQSFRGIGNKPVFNSIFDKGDFMWRSRCNVYGGRKTIAVRHSHDLRTFAPLGLSHCEAPFFATTKVASMKHSDRSSLPRLRKSSAKASSTVLSVPNSTHSWKRRWQVWYEGKRPGKSAQGAPVRNIQNMPFITARSSIRGPPYSKWDLGHVSRFQQIHDSLDGWQTSVLHAGDVLAILPEYAEYEVVSRLLTESKDDSGEGTEQAEDGDESAGTESSS